ncbi:hypothetical protein Tco_0222450 [Tanacetum coccineum]
MTYPCHWFSEQVGLAGDLGSTNDVLIPLCMTRSSNKDLFQTCKNPERVFRSSRKLSKTRSLDYLSSPEFNFIFNLEDQFEKEETDTMGEPTMEEYITKTRDGYGGSDHKDANEHIKKVLEIVDLFHIPNITQDHIMLRAFPMSLTGAASEVILFYKGLEVPTRQILDSKGAIPTMTITNAKGPHYTKDSLLKEEGKTLEEAYYTQFGVSFPQGGQYRAAALGFH